MLIFDAFLGVNDRHFYNWGIIEDIQGKSSPQFAPLFDTSRGLLWNIPESKLENISNDEVVLNKWLNKYINRSYPKMSLEHLGEVNHFQLLKHIIETEPKYIDICIGYTEEYLLNAIFEVLDNEFKRLFSPLRNSLIKQCLLFRFNHIKEMLDI